MSKDEVNYFGAHPHVDGDIPGGVRRDSMDAGNVVSLFGVEEGNETFRHDVEDSLQFRTQGLERVFTRDTVPKDAWIEIDLDAIAHNVRAARKRVGFGRLLAAVVKADAYGHGSVPVSRVALKNGADRLAVSSVEEGAKLRKAGITAPILILSQPPIHTVDLLLRYDLTPTVCTSDFALALGEMADFHGKVAKYHLAVDSGMNRIGVHYLDVVDFCRSIGFHRGLELEGTFTHFATADEATDWNFRIQLERFNESLQHMHNACIDPGIVHSANSAAIERYPEAHFDMVRQGITMYGLSPAPDVIGLDDLRPAMAVKCRITYVKEPQIGEGVSYGMNYRVAKPVQIATVPIGYADGLSRSLSGRMKVLINGRVCSQVGNICMDQMMIEIPHGRAGIDAHPEANVGDEVVIIGRQGDYEISVDTMAEELGTINYEIICDFKMRLPRVYLGSM